MSIFNHPNFIPLQHDAIIWRYLDLEKYYSFLKEKALFFCRADKFSDPFEGSLPKIEAEHRIKEELRSAKLLGLDFDEEKSTTIVADLGKMHRDLKKNTVVNCWHINNNESDAMWRLYLKDNEGVAIQTTCKLIYDIIEKAKERIGLSKIRYINYETDIWFHRTEYPHTNYNTFIPFIHKRIEFAQENEFRLLHELEIEDDIDEFWNRQPNHKGVFVQVDPCKIIQKIYLPPTIDRKAVRRIEEISKEFGFNFQLEKSKLSYEPLY